MQKRYLFLLWAGVATTLSATDVTLSGLSSVVCPAGKPQSKITDIRTNGAGEAFVLANFGSITATDTTTFYGADFTGADYGTGASYNTNLLFAKTDKSGQLLWAIHSIDGEYTDGAFTPTADGGAVLALKFRLSIRNKVDGQKSSYLSLKDATGRVVSDSTTYDGTNYAHIVLVCVSEAGAITRMQPIYTAHTNAEGTAFADVASIIAVAQDEGGNLYFAGKQAMDIAVGTDTLHAVNTGDWTGDTQSINNYTNSFVVKTDTAFQPLRHITSSGCADYVLQATYREGALMVVGYVPTATEVSYKFGSKETATLIPYRSIVVCHFDKDLQNAYIAPIQQVQEGKSQQVQLLQTAWAADGKSLYIAGSTQSGIVYDNQNFYAGGGTAPGNIHDGLLLQVDAATGKLLHAAMAGTATLNQYTGVVIYEDQVLALQYAMNGGISLCEYTTDLQPSRTTLLAKQEKKLTVSAAMAYSGEKLFTAFRAAGGADIVVADTTICQATTWYSTLALWDLSYEGAGGSDTLVQPAATVDKVMFNGQLYIRKGHQLYTIQGQTLNK